MNQIIREYELKDKDILIRLFESLQKYAVGFDPIQRIRCLPGFGENVFKDMMDSFTENEGKCFVVEIGGKVAGHIWGLIAKQSKENLLSVNPTRLGIIKDFYIDEQFRRQKIGSALLKKMEDYFKSSGCDAVWLQVFSPNRDAYAFYKHQGYLDRDLEMLKKI